MGSVESEAWESTPGDETFGNPRYGSWMGLCGDWGSTVNVLSFVEKTLW